MEWLRLVSILVGLLISLPVFFLSNLIRLCRIGRRLFHVKPRPSPPACLLDPRYGQHKFLTVHGVRLHYVESGDPGKPLLLFVHGWPQFWFAWRYQIEHFQKVGRSTNVHNPKINKQWFRTIMLLRWTCVALMTQTSRRGYTTTSS